MSARSKRVATRTDAPDSRSYEFAVGLDSCQTYALAAWDDDRELENKLQIMSNRYPFENTRYDQDPESQHDTNPPVYFVHISNFFDDRNNLAYYIRGTRNVERFLGGMSGMQAYDGPLLYTITPHQCLYILESVNLRRVSQAETTRKVPKNEMPMGRLKWRYLYETGRLAWEGKGLVEPYFDSGDSGTMGGTFPNEYGRKSHPQDGLALAVQSTEPAPGPVSKGKMKASHVTTHAVSNGNSDINFGGSASSTNEKQGKEYKSASNVVETAVDLGEDRQNLDAYKRALQADNIDDMWVKMRDRIHRKQSHVAELDPVMRDLTNDLISLTRREESLEQGRAPDPHQTGGSNSAKDSTDLPEDIAFQRAQLIQRFANAGANRWKVRYKDTIYKGLGDLQDIVADRHEIKAFLMDLLLHEGQDRRPPTATNTLEPDEIQTVMQLADVTELLREYECKRQELEEENGDPEQVTGLEDLGRSLESQTVNCVDSLADILFQYWNKRQFENAWSAAARDTGAEQLTEYQEDLVTKVMELTHQNERVAIRLLQRSW
ncbi:hypothetical protein N0V94_005662 [Neodidymelliopsis sp. IMI 364377]|nr:hypothetical protein N0V94_005662 [Neodidymelliopsis sp. IMI 364377]